MAQALPLDAVLGLFAGALVDRRDRRKVYLVATTGQACCSLLLAAQAFFLDVPVMAVLVGPASAGLLLGHGAPAPAMPWTLTYSAALYGAFSLPAMRVNGKGTPGSSAPAKRPGQAPRPSTPVRRRTPVRRPRARGSGVRGQSPPGGLPGVAPPEKPRSEAVRAFREHTSPRAIDRSGRWLSLLEVCFQLAKALLVLPGVVAAEEEFAAGGKDGPHLGGCSAAVAAVSSCQVGAGERCVHGDSPSVPASGGVPVPFGCGHCWRGVATSTLPDVWAFVSVPALIVRSLDP